MTDEPVNPPAGPNDPKPEAPAPEQPAAAVEEQPAAPKRSLPRKALGYLGSAFGAAAGWVGTKAWHGVWSNRTWKGKLVTAFIAANVAATPYYFYEYKMQNFSTGHRAGVIDKGSLKGWRGSVLTDWMCSTYEGQLAMQNFAHSGELGQRTNPGSATNAFVFSVPDQKVRDKIDEILQMNPSPPVVLEYEQKYSPMAYPVPFFCRRQTEYEVTGVNVGNTAGTDGNIMPATEELKRDKEVALPPRMPHPH